MHHRFVSGFVVAMALLAVSPLSGDDEKTESPVAGESAAAPKADEAAAPKAGESALSESDSKPDPGEAVRAEDGPDGELTTDPPEHADGGGEPGHAEPGQEDPGHGDAGHSDAGHSDAGHSDAGHSGGHDADHDPHDLTHANAGEQLNSPQEFKSDLAIWTFVVFVCLLVVLGKFAWGPVLEGLEKREQSIAAMIDEAQQRQEKAAEQLRLYEEKIAAAGEESRAMVAQARQDAEAAGARIVAEAEAAAEKQRQRAVADITNAKSAALDEIKTEGVSLAVQLAGQIVRRELTPQDHSQLIDEALKQLPSRN